MKLISSYAQLASNINSLETFLHSSDDNIKKYVVSLVRFGICFIPYLVNGKLHFAPSRFIGYENNNPDQHLSSQKDGRDTNKVIAEILEHKPEPNAKLQESFNEYCRTLGVVPTKGTFGAKRKFWKVQDGLSRSTSLQERNAFLFTWNPKEWVWEDLHQRIQDVKEGRIASENWRCKSHKQIKVGDQFYLMMVGNNQRGIFASGIVMSAPFQETNRKDKRNNPQLVRIEFQRIVDPFGNESINIEQLPSDYNWTPQSSGMPIPPNISDSLKLIFESSLNSQFHSVEVNNRKFTEGTAYTVVQTRYERRPEARADCLIHYGYSCSVCGIDFEARYGEIGRNFIHVHHIKPLFAVEEAYVPDPVKDLIPVCPNCHAMLHKRKDPYTIEELKSMLL